MIKVNETCIGCGACVALDPEHFDFNEGVSVAISQEVTETVKDAAASCPVGAIEVTEENVAENNDDTPKAA